MDRSGGRGGHPPVGAWRDGGRGAPACRRALPAEAGPARDRSAGAYVFDTGAGEGAATFVAQLRVVRACADERDLSLAPSLLYVDHRRGERGLALGATLRRLLVDAARGRVRVLVVAWPDLVAGDAAGRRLVMRALRWHGVELHVPPGDLIAAVARRPEPLRLGAP